MSEMTPKQARFVQEYLIDLNGTQAAIRAGFPAKTAATVASEYLRKPHIAAAVAEGQEKRADRTGVTQDRVLRELAILAFSDVRHFSVDDNGQLLLLDGAPDEAWRAVSSVKHRVITAKNGDVIRECEYRLWNKTDALQMAGKHLGMFLERHANPDGTPIRFTLDLGSVNAGG